MFSFVFNYDEQFISEPSMLHCHVSFTVAQKGLLAPMPNPTHTVPLRKTALLSKMRTLLVI